MKRREITEETRRKMSESAKKRTDRKPFSQEARTKMSLSAQKRWANPKEKERMLALLRKRRKQIPANEVAKLYKEGFFIYEIAEKFDCSSTVILRVMRENGIPSRKRNSMPRRNKNLE